MADAAARGAAGLADLAARATALGGGLGGDENDVFPAARSPGSASDDEEEHGSQGADAGSEHGSVPPASSTGRRTPALAELPLVTDELAAIAASADSVLGPKLVTAIAKARVQRPLQRAYVKNLEVQDPDAGKWRRLRAYLGEDSAAVDVFRHLGGLLVHELVAEDPELDWQTGPHDPRSLLAALRELLELCALVPSTQVQSRVGPSLSTGGDVGRLAAGDGQRDRCQHRQRARQRASACAAKGRQGQEDDDEEGRGAPGGVQPAP